MTTGETGTKLDSSVVSAESSLTKPLTEQSLKIILLQRTETFGNEVAAASSLANLNAISDTFLRALQDLDDQIRQDASLDKQLATDLLAHVDASRQSVVNRIINIHWKEAGDERLLRFFAQMAAALNGLHLLTSRAELPLAAATLHNELIAGNYLSLPPEALVFAVACLGLIAAAAMYRVSNQLVRRHEASANRLMDWNYQRGTGRSGTRL